MSRLRRMKQRATRLGVYPLPAFDPLTQLELHKRFDIFVESEGLLAPRGLSLSRREAIQLASRIARNPASLLEVKFFAACGL